MAFDRPVRPVQLSDFVIGRNSRPDDLIKITLANGEVFFVRRTSTNWEVDEGIASPCMIDAAHESSVSFPLIVGDRSCIGAYPSADWNYGNLKTVSFHFGAPISSFCQAKLRRQTKALATATGFTRIDRCSDRH